MIKIKKWLIMLTKNYPYDIGEEFIEDEILQLSKEFERVVIIPTSVTKPEKQTRALPRNVTVFPIASKTIKKSVNLKAMIGFPFVGSSKYIDENDKNSINRSLKKRLYLSYFLAKAKIITKTCKKIIDIFFDGIECPDKVAIYSYWLHDTAFAAGELKRYMTEKLPTAKISAISRAHGYDLYEYRKPRCYIPLRRWIMGNLDFIYPCSENGSSYLKEKYPEFADRIDTSYLGTQDTGLNPERTDGKLHIVTCCYISPVKRMNLFAEALHDFSVRYKNSVKISWTHIGAGEGLAELKQYAQENLGIVDVNFLGNVKKDEIAGFYRDNHVSFIANVSESEGLPVTLMEASSFGVPAIVTDVGGVSEIVLDGETGFLLPADFLQGDLSAAIFRFANMTEQEVGKMRKSTRENWEHNFCADKNYSEFASKI